MIFPPLRDLFNKFNLRQKKKRYKVLFVTKSQSSESSGWYNPSAHMTSLLIKDKFEVKWVSLIDCAAIDWEITLYKPDVVIIESLWVSPDQITVLSKNHSLIKWVVWIQSTITYLAIESLALDYIFNYLKNPSVSLAVSSLESHKELKNLLLSNLSDEIKEAENKVIYLPNCFDTTLTLTLTPTEIPNIEWGKFRKSKEDEIQIGCLGDLCILNNPLSQAFAAIQFANKIGRTLKFYINSNKIKDSAAENILKNLQVCFKQNPPHQLIELEGLNEATYWHLINKLDLGLQISELKSFNNIIAEFIINNIPVIGSHEISWIPQACQSNNNIENIITTLFNVYNNRDYVTKLSLILLEDYNEHNLTLWKNFLEF